jgi:hypothetical protein
MWKDSNNYLRYVANISKFIFYQVKITFQTGIIQILILSVPGYHSRFDFDIIHYCY